MPIQNKFCWMFVILYQMADRIPEECLEKCLELSLGLCFRETPSVVESLQKILLTVK